MFLPSRTLAALGKGRLIRSSRDMARPARKDDLRRDKPWNEKVLDRWANKDALHTLRRMKRRGTPRTTGPYAEVLKTKAKERFSLFGHFTGQTKSQSKL